MDTDALPTARGGQAGLARALVPLGGALLVVNLPLLAVAWQDRSFGAFGIAIIVGPAANGVVALLFLCLSRWIRRWTGVSTRFHVASSLLAPLGAALADFYVIRSMGLHGC